MSELKRIAVVEHENDVRRILSTLIEALRMGVTVEAKDRFDALNIVRRIKPDLMLIDLELPGGSAFDLIAKVRAELPRTRFIALTSRMSSDHLDDALAAGVHAYLQKPVDPVELQAAIQAALRGGRYVASDIVGRIIDGYMKTVVQHSARKLLTTRQWEVAQLLVAGLSNMEASARLGISVRTVEQHRALALERVGARNVAQLANRLRSPT